MLPSVKLEVSGDRFQVVYRIAGSEQEAAARAEQICVEQTIEFPADLVADDDIRAHIIGQVESIQVVDEGVWEAVISYAYETTAYTLPQALNVIFGNISLRPGVLVKRLNLPKTFTNLFKGPRFGQQGLRQLCKAPAGPLFCSALKPIGLSSTQLAEQAYQLASGGIHFIKDDHGICDQKFAPFRTRIPRCVAAVAKANQETGLNCRYVPTINSAADQIFDDARWAREQGVGGLLVLPGISGFDSMRCLADDDRLALPILGHPALIGSFVASPVSGLSHYVLFGQLMRLAGADASIYPNFGGRFSFSREACLEIVGGATCDMAAIKPVFPSPGGGMNFNNIPEMVRTYGEDVMFLIGGALHQEGASIMENCQRLRQLVDDELAVARRR